MLSEGATLALGDSALQIRKPKDHGPAAEVDRRAKAFPLVLLLIETHEPFLDKGVADFDRACGERPRAPYKVQGGQSVSFLSV